MNSEQAKDSWERIKTILMNVQELKYAGISIYQAVGINKPGRTKSTPTPAVDEQRKGNSTGHATGSPALGYYYVAPYAPITYEQQRPVARGGEGKSFSSV